MIRAVPYHVQESVRPGRIQALMDLGFPIRQARFLVHVLVFSGVFLERQYRAFTGLAHDQKTNDFLSKLVGDGYATPITPGALHRGRLYHVQSKPLYEAIGEPDNRHRKVTSLGRFVERLMLLDAVLADRYHGWLGTESDKRTYFREALEMELPDDWYPHLTFGDGVKKTTRFFPDKLPIGVPLKGHRRHVFLYLATREVPAEFRVFLLRYADLLKSVDEWTIRVLLPRRFRKAAALFRYAVRDAFMMPLTPGQVEELDWYFRGRRGELVCPSPDRDLDLATAARTFGAARFGALYRFWQQRGVQALWAMQSPTHRRSWRRHRRDSGGALCRPPERHDVTDGSASRGVNDPGADDAGWPRAEWMGSFTPRLARRCRWTWRRPCDGIYAALVAAVCPAIRRAS